MTRFKSTIFKFLAVTISAIALSACSNDDPGDSPYVTPEKEPASSTVLIYAVATNSLEYNLISDKDEMLMAADKIDLDKNNVLVFQTVYEYDDGGRKTGNGEVSLVKLVKDEQGYAWQTEKVFNDNKNSLDPSRVSEIIALVTDQYPANSYGLVFWSHSTGSQPYNGTRGVSLPIQYSFGQDLTNKGEDNEQIDIDILAKAIPDNLFEYVWFDSCYMSNIESIYQFRGKCNTYVGYPTEVLEYGLPYDLVLPSMVGENPNLVEAAEIFFQYYSRSFGTVAVIDMNHIDELSDFCRTLYEGEEGVTASSLTRYTRGTTGPFYDLGDYTKAFALKKGETLSQEEWESVLDKCVLYKATTSGSYLGLSIDKENYSGISTHVYTFGEDTEKESYYKSLDWFRTVFL